MAKDRVEAGRRGKSAGVVKPTGAAKKTPPAGAKRTAAKPNVVKKSAARPKGQFYALLGAVVAVAAVFIGYQMTRPKTEAVSIPSNTPLPKAEGYLLGSPTAPVQVLEFADFECPACSNFATITEPDVRSRLVQTGQISYRFIDFPLSMHRNSFAASNAAACANEQGKFWEMHDQLFANQDRWNGEATSRPKGELKKLAQSVGLDAGKWEQCYDAKKYQLNIVANQREGERRQVPSTPTFVIGNKMLPGNIGYDQFKAYVDSAAALAAPKQVADSGKK